jgi:WD40 repeat protein
MSPDGKTLASGGIDTQVILWDVQAGKERATLRRADPPNIRPDFQDGMVAALAFSPDGKTLASGTRGVLSNTEKGTKQIVGEITLWDATAGKEKTTLKIPGISVWSVAFSPDGKALASAGGAAPAAADTTIRGDLKEVPWKDKAFFREIGEVRVWDLAAGKDRPFLHGGDGRIFSVAFSPDGKTLASGGRDGAVRLWDVETGRERACLRETVHEVRAVAFSPDGKTLASVHADPDDPVKLWDLASGRVRARLKGHAGPVWSVAFGADGALATAANLPPSDPGKPYDTGGEVRLWDASTGRSRGVPLTFPHYGSCVAFGARGKMLAAAGARGTQAAVGGGPGEITLWELGR